MLARGPGRRRGLRLVAPAGPAACGGGACGLWRLCDFRLAAAPVASCDRRNVSRETFRALCGFAALPSSPHTHDGRFPRERTCRSDSAAESGTAGSLRPTGLANPPLRRQAKRSGLARRPRKKRGERGGPERARPCCGKAWGEPTERTRKTFRFPGKIIFAIIGVEGGNSLCTRRRRENSPIDVGKQELSTFPPSLLLQLLNPYAY